MSVYSGLSIIQIGSRKYGVYLEESDWDYMVIIPESRVQSFLDGWKDAKITEFPNPKRYRVKGIPPTVDHVIEGSPPDGVYDLTVVPKPDGMSDNRFIKENWRIYWMIHISDIPPEHEKELKERLLYIKKWAKDNNVYGGAYPGGIAYFLYTLNTILKGYDRKTTYSQLYQRCLYYHSEYKYTHITYMADASFNHMRDIIKGTIREYKYRYLIETNQSEETLHASKYLLNDMKNAYIDNDCILYSSYDVSEKIERWIEDLHRYNIKATFRKL